MTKAVTFGVLVVLLCVCRCLWFMLEVLMTKNENNSHAFLRKMVEDIKQTKDAQCPDDAKANEVLTHTLTCTHTLIHTQCSKQTMKATAAERSRKVRRHKTKHSQSHTSTNTMH